MEEESAEIMPLTYPHMTQRRKDTSTAIFAATGFPSLPKAGSNFQLVTASIAFSSSPMPKLLITRRLVGFPFSSTIKTKITERSIFAFRASSGYVGGGDDKS